VPVDHHDHDAIIELIRVPSRFEADVLIAKLEANGIKASPGYGDAGGYLPRVSAFGNHAVMVFESDFAKASEIIADDTGEPADS
jgi:hypothetical protein